MAHGRRRRQERRHRRRRRSQDRLLVDATRAVQTGRLAMRAPPDLAAASATVGAILQSRPDLHYTVLAAL